MKGISRHSQLITHPRNGNAEQLYINIIYGLVNEMTESTLAVVANSL